jgi:Zn-dependent protease
MPADLIQKIAIALIPAVFAITVHEAAHGYVARYFGDRTAEMLGRLTLNPIKHIDPIGTILVPILTVAMGGFFFGWAKPVPIAMRNLRQPRRDMALVAAAGPSANILMAIGWAYIIRLLPSAGGAGLQFLSQMAVTGVFFNVVLAVLNMLPIPPLDGSRVLSSFLPPRTAAQYERIEPYGLFIILGLIMTGILWQIMLPIMNLMIQFISKITGIS